MNNNQNVNQSANINDIIELRCSCHRKVGEIIKTSTSGSNKGVVSIKCNKCKRVNHFSTNGSRVDLTRF